MTSPTPSTTTDPAASLESRIGSLSDKQRALLDAMRRKAAAAPADPSAIPPRDPSRPVPLSFSQQRLWFLSQLQPDTPAYNIATAQRLTGPLDVAALARALDTIVERHAVLRTVFAVEGDDPVQRILPAPSAWPLPVRDLSGLPPGLRLEEAARIAADEAMTPFDLAAGPVLRTGLLRLAADDHVFTITVHHIAADAWSMNLFARELAEAYAAHSDGRIPALAPLPCQYADVAAWQRGWLAGERLDAELAHWRARLEGVPPLELPRSLPRPPVQGFAGGGHFFSVPADLTARLDRLAADNGATLFMTLLAAVQILLFQESGQEDFAIGAPVANRTRRTFEPLIGFFANTLALRADLSGDPTFRELLGRVAAVARDAYAHQDVPFEKLVDELRVDRDLSRNPLVQAVFALQNAPADAPSLPGLRTEPIRFEQLIARFDLELHMARHDGRLEAVLQYDRALFDAADAARLAGHLLTLLGSIADDPGRPISALSSLPPDERTLVLDGWNRTGAPEDDPPVHRQVAVRAAQAPDAPAIGDGHRTLSYRTLEERAARLARRLRGLGVGTDRVAALCLDRSVALTVAQLAVLKAGGAYLPLDPRHPDERRRRLLAEADALVLVTTAALAPAMAGAAPAAILLDEDGVAEGDGPEAPLPDRGPHPDALAYVIFTSGSTGKPKGVALTHRSLANLCAWHRDAFAVTAAARATLLAGVAFDASVWELWPYLTAGAFLRTVPALTAADPDALAALLLAERITHAFVPTPLADGLLRHPWPEDTALRTLLAGGERLAAGPATALPFTLVNNYGPTESTVVASSGAVVPGGRAVPPIGTPIRNTRILILNRALEPVGIGMPGELCIAGSGLARGYAGNPAATAERFLPDPFGPPGSRLYRTGDRARWTADGRIEFLGRLDEQVKIRGHRIEPAEIRAALGSHPGVRHCAVIARDDRLIAYVVTGDGDAEDVDGWRAHLSERLPAYMVPADFVTLGALPLTPNGKLDVRALPNPERPAEADDDDPPRGRLEDWIAGIWAEVLNRPRIGRNDNFFALGGHSLMAAQVVSRIRAQGPAQGFGRGTAALPLADLFTTPTVAGLALRIAARQEADASDVDGDVDGDEALLPDDLPPGVIALSPGQERWWFLSRLLDDPRPAHIACALDLHGTLDLPALARALAALVERHQPLRTAMVEEEGRPAARLLDAPPSWPLPVDDLTGLPAPCRGAEADRRSAADAARPFALDREPLLRAHLARLAPDRHRLTITLHHAAADGWTIGVLVRELSALHAGRRLPPLPLDYGQVARLQRRFRHDRALAWWTARLAELPTLDLDLGPPDPGVDAEAGGAVARMIPAPLAGAIDRLAHDHGVTLFMVLLAASQVLLARLSGQRDFAVGTPVAGRLKPEWEALAGFFVNTLVLRSALPAAGATVADLLAAVRTETLDALARQELPFDRLVEALQPARASTRNPLFQVLVAVQNAPLPPMDLPGLRVEALPSPLLATRLDLELHATPGPQGLGLVATYRTDRFPRAAVERLLAGLESLLAAMVASPQARWDSLPALPDEERATLDRWGRGAEPDSGFALLARIAAQDPTAPALADGGRTWSYGALRSHATRWVHGLRAAGLRPGDALGIAVGRTAEHGLLILAAWMAGAAAVPLEPHLPPARLAAMARAAGVRLVVTRRATMDRLPPDARLLFVDDAPEAAFPDHGRFADPHPAQTSYILFTSGSTGTPKGVAMTHGALATLAAWHARRYAAAARTLQYAPLSFDVSIQEYATTWSTGGTLVLVDEATRRDPLLLLDHIRRYAVERLFLPVAMLHELAEAVAADRTPVPTPIRAVVTAGEALRVTPAVRRWAAADGWTLDNQYGPTETHVVSGEKLDGDPADWPQVPGLGRPVDGVRLRVADAAGLPLPIGVVGELLVGGTALARGYLTGAATAERFVPDPLADGERLYRTGDRARWTADGRLDYLGRADHQVKLRGHRVELGEVEAALELHPAVAHALTAVAGGTLVAHVEPRPGAGADPADLRLFLRDRLPDYMLPGRWRVTERLPRNANGKLDRRALPALEESAAIGRSDGTPPATPTEELAAALWRELLDCGPVHREDDFFALGGHSLRATQMVSRLARRHGMQVPVAAIFDQPTLAGFAAALDDLILEATARQLDEVPDDELASLLASLEEEATP